jgi:hypothetical protein
MQQSTIGLLLPLVVCSLAATLLCSIAKGVDISHELGKIKPTQLEEISGLAASRQNANVLWLHNDGDSGQMFAVSMGDWSPRGCRAIKDGRHRDWPRSRQGVDYLYLR